MKTYTLDKFFIFLISTLAMLSAFFQFLELMITYHTDNLLNEEKIYIKITFPF